LLLLALAAPGRAAELPAEPLPAAYTELLAPRLSPIDPILAAPVTSANPSDAGVCLLDERLVSSELDGRKVIVWHFAYKTLTDAGVSTNSDDVFPYRKHQQKIHLVLAETIQADGTRQPVQPNAVLIQSPQRQAEYSLYDDQAELKVIFPNVKPGSVTHGIIVIEDTVARFPGEFNQNFTWSRQWGTERLNFHLDLPTPLAARLKNETVGSALPALTVTAAGDRTVYRWTADAIRGERYEVESPPSNQIGPAIHLSSIGSWEDVGRWFRDMLQGRDELSPELAKQVDAWVPAGASRAATIAALHARVADDVRYVGLELGTADYQPHHCNEVWANRYGDCKDKANLLVAMLRRRGIDASIALVNTSHLGIIDRRTPDYRVFTHAIVAIRGEKGGYTFTDPTISYSIPGMLSPGSADRDVLVVTRDSAEWMHTPATPAGSMLYDFDLKLEESGDLSGWLTVTAEGYYSAAERDTFTRLQPIDLRSEMSRRVRRFYPAAEIVDATREDPARDKPHVVKAYFTVAGAARDQDSKQTIVFPQNGSLFPDVGDRAERQTTYFLYRDSIRVKARIALARDFAADQVAPDFQADSGVATLKASWQVTPRECEARLDLTMKTSAVRREEFGRFYQSIQAARAWLAQPLILHPVEAGAAQARRKTELDFPLMPTGDGQINLVDQRYPESGDPELRRQALEKTIQLFPKDKAIVFRAGVRLAVLDWNADRLDAAHKRLANLLKSYGGGQIAPDVYAWGETIDGLVLRDLKKDAEALAVLERVSRNANLGAERRARAAPAAAELLAAKSPNKAIDLLLAISALPDGSTAAVEAKLAELLLAKRREKDLKAHLRQLVDGRPDSCEQELTDLLATARAWKNDATAAQRRLAALVREVRPHAGEDLAKAVATLELDASLTEIRDQTGTTLAGPLFAPWLRSDAPRQGLADFTKAIEAADAAKDAAGAFRLCLQSIVQHGADTDFPERLWRAANYGDWVQRQGKTPIDPNVVDVLLDLCDLLPTTNDYFYEGRLLRAGRLGNAGTRAGEIAVLQGVLDTTQPPENYAFVLHRRIAAALERDHAYAAAVAHYDAVEKIAPEYRAGTDLLVRSVLIHLHLGQDDAALRVIGQLKTIAPETRAQATLHMQADEFIALADSGQAAAVWAAGRAWWPQWSAYVQPYLGTLDGVETVVPAVTSFPDVGEEIRVARVNKDARAYFTSFGTIVSAARWLPSFGSEAAGLFALTVGIKSDRAEDLRSVLVTLLRGPHPEGLANRGARQVQLSAHLFDSGQAAEALAVARNFLRTTPPPPEDDVTRSMRRLWALAANATKEDMPEAAEALARDLGNAKLAPQRLFTVQQLAALYRAMGRSSHEELLLKREIANPIIAAEPGVKELQARLTQLVGERDFTAELTRWRTRLNLPWYDLAEPRSLDDPRLGNLEDVLNSPERNFSTAEQVKLFILAAGDLRRPFPQRQIALRAAIYRLLTLAPTYRQLDEIAASVIDNPEFDEETRVSTLWQTLLKLCSEDRPADYQRWRGHALCAQFNANTKKNLALLDRVIATDRHSAEAVLALARQMSAEEVTNFAGFGFYDLFGDLLRLGDFAAAEQFIALIPSWKLAADVQDTVPARQLDYTRRLRFARANEKVHAVFLAATRRRFPELPDSLPAEYADLRLRDTVPRCSPEATRQACLFLVRQNRFNRANFDLWRELLRSLTNVPGEEEFVEQLAAPALAAAETDAVRNQVLDVFYSGVDTDKPRVLAALNQAAAPLVTASGTPASYLTYRLFQAQIARRTGTLTDVETVLHDMTDPSAAYFQKALNLEVFVRRGDLAALRRTVDSIPTATLLSPGLLDESLHAFALLDLPDELEVARTTARTFVRTHVVQSWADHDPLTAYRAVGLAEELGEPELLPAAWVDELGRDLPDPFVRQVVRLIDARLRKDWNAAEEIGTAFLRDYPTHYHYYWHVGLAASELGHRPEAIAALKTYVKYSKEERNYPAAVALLKKLEGGK
jgi:transglutaminase-like putative cysteine protease